ncbi:WYL domain-containing protein [Algoriphagus boseongensis]|uniref:WYL domain-containing protein n=1 Tax=Algoriphagus boseongensis TaxID=1442587 RepID=A0A4R6T3V5_9BACT|nr:WYL domain-containing protein [Algoriphagus boseongensis]TDQ15191.1 WYL domain-containing protein [Algoriphagus boseongensis]
MGDVLVEKLIWFGVFFLIFLSFRWLSKSSEPNKSREIHRNDTPIRQPPKTRVISPTIEETVNFAIQNGKDLYIEYQNYNGELSTRRLSNLSLNNEYSGYHNAHVKAYCHKRNEERNFKISRISRAQIVD